ncbi:MAG: AarF/ABC1/UbiB kinase family protein [Pseudanabaenaceae cyanobacterium bins.68]|nr:AarF/ABC1/UbiB kinase family protein [Pseudanabaenaceae cyanobacterium bins.68]
MPVGNSLPQLDRYDAEAIANYYRQFPWQVWRRGIAIFAPILGLLLTLWWDRKTNQFEQKAKQRAVALRQLLTQLGPAFIKIGQALSTRPDIVPPVYMDELAQLQDQLPPFANQQAFQFIREELGADPEQIYAYISPTPIAAASLGQVYKARLHSGETVAVKVQRPGIAQGIAMDMYILRSLAGWAMSTFKFIRSNLKAILDEFASRIFEEMDYTCEGANADRFAAYYRHLPEIYVPKIYWQYTAKRVLTMEWIDGVKLTELETIKQMGFDSRHIIEVGVQCSLVQLLDQGFFHADPHPGNLLVMSNGHLAYLDFGMMSQVTPEQRFGLIEAIIHLVNRDFDALSQDYVRLGFLKPGTNLEGITPALSRVFSNSINSNSMAELDFKELTDQLSQVMYDYPFQVPAYYALIIRSLVTLEGIALSVDRNFKVLSVAYPYVANRLLVDAAPELRNALKELLFKDGDFRWQRFENLLRNAKSNQGYDLSNTLDKVSDFLLSERGTFIRDRLTTEFVNLLEEFALTRFAQTTEAKKLTQVSNIWTAIGQDIAMPVNQLLPLAGKILTKPETRELGLGVISQLAQRAIARTIRGVALPPQAEQLVAIESSSLHRVLNGREW